jgi:hypothetical protein
LNLLELSEVRRISTWSPGLTPGLLVKAMLVSTVAAGMVNDADARGPLSTYAVPEGGLNGVSMLIGGWFVASDPSGL